MWLPFLGRDDIERRVIINVVGPTWEGNQTWFIAAGGAMFAAWPLVNAAAFSGFTWRSCCCCSRCFSVPSVSTTAVK